MSRSRFDIACRVVDNYGDAGVCWRLARVLAAEHGLEVILRIDRLAALARIESAVDPGRDTQMCAGVAVHRLDDASPAPQLPDVVIEAFGCGLPPPYVDAMANATKPPLWINLEYLSAEPWVDSAHGLASADPRLPLTRYFWFPGFTPRTAGLIREAGLFTTRDAWKKARAANEPGDAFRVLLFSYPNRALPALFDAWAESDDAVVCTIPEGVATSALDAWLRGNVPHAGQSIARGRLTLDVIAFTTQDGFDRLLWGSDLNIVRGEDSFVRAQWAARPFVWQPYPQAHDAHRLKQDAFLTRYADRLDASLALRLSTFWRAFDGEDGAETAAAWPDFRDALPGVARHAGRWADELAALPELAAGLADFARSRI